MGALGGLGGNGGLGGILNPELSVQLDSSYVWLDFSELGLSDGTAIATITNKGTAGDFAQTTEAQKPIFKTAIQNSLGIARFDSGADQNLTADSLTLAEPSQWYVVCLYTSGATAAFNRTIWTATENGEFGGHNSADNVYTYSSGAVPTASATDDSFHYYSILMNGNSGSINVDGSTTAMNTNAGGISNETVYIGSTSLSIVGDIGEILMFSGAHSAAQIALVEGYLSAKWGL